MAPPTYIHAVSLTDDVATFEVISVSGLAPGWPIEVAGCGEPFDGVHTIETIDSVDLLLTTVIEHANIAQTTVVGRLFIPVTWITVDDVVEFLGVAPAETVDVQWLDVATAAAQDWCYARRAAAGYLDAPHVLPSPRVKVGAVMKAAELYRSRGSIDGFSSFQQLETVVPINTAGEIMRMLGLSRPGIA